MKICSKKKATILLILVFLYGLSAWSFSSSYFQTYDAGISAKFRSGVKECVDFVNVKSFENVNVHGVYYPQILYFDETPTQDFIATRNYRNYPDPFLDVEHFTKYTFSPDYDSLGNYDAHIVPSWELSEFPEEQYSCKIFDYYAVVFPK